MIRSVYSSKAVQLCLSLLSVVLLGSMFPQLLPKWLAFASSGWVRPLRWVLSILTDAGMATVMFGAWYIRDAQSSLEIERESVRAEQRAFLEFADQIQNLAVPPEPSVGSSPLLVDSEPNEEHPQRIRDTYRETVMAVPHFDEEYGESLRENMAIELSPETATAVVDGQQYSPRLQQLLINQAQIAAHRRDELLETVNAEDTSLAEAQQLLREATIPLDQTADPSLKDCSFSDLQTKEEALRTRIEICEELIMDRQEELHQHPRMSLRSTKQLYKYLYSELEVTFPVLNATLETIQKLRTHRKNVIRALTCRI